MKPKTAELILKWLLRLDGAFMMLAIIAVFMPSTLMQVIHERLGLGEMPTGPIVEYLARSCSMLYAIHGVIVFAISFNMPRYWQLVRLVAILHVAIGLTLIGIDLKSGMPWYWISFEGPSITLAAIFMVWLWYRASSKIDQVQ